MNHILQHVLVAVVFGLFAKTGWAQTSGPPPALPPLSRPSMPPCTTKAVPLGIDRIKSAQGVDRVLFDAQRLNATVLFDNADVLKVYSIGCHSRLIEARLWLTTKPYVDEALLKEAKYVTGLLLDAPRAHEVQRIIENSMFDSQFVGRIRHIQAHNLIISVTSMPIDDGDTYMQIVYLDPPKPRWPSLPIR
jgi:hypothetical protein